MLTNDLLRAQRRGEKIIPRYIKSKEREEFEQLAERAAEILDGMIDARREDIERDLAALECRPAARPIVQGLIKLLLDRCEIGTSSKHDAPKLRKELFLLAAQTRRGLGPTESFPREDVLAEAGAALGISSEELQKELFGDLRDNERLRSFKRLSGSETVDRYNVALAQGVLLRATKVTLTITDEEPGRVRQLFRAAKFQGLLHRVSKSPTGAHCIELDGPLSLFSASQKYGLKLALFLPAVLRCKKWILRANILWGKQRRPCIFELSPKAKLVPRDKRIQGVAPRLNKLQQEFRKLSTTWDVAESEEIFDLPGSAVCVPDLVFQCSETGERIFLEAFGFWSRAAVFQRLESIAEGLDVPLLLCAGKQLRVSEGVLDDQAENARLYVYKSAIRAREVLRRLESIRNGKTADEA